MVESDLPAAPASATDREGWLSALSRLADNSGDFLSLGTHHWALFVDESPTLIVSFETVAEARARPGQMPLAHAIAAEHGWSHLCILAEGQTWWRDPAVWRYFDRLVDDAFFEDFDRVLFTGAGMGAYAACAYSVAAPGATVLAFAPCATQSPDQAGWDRRHLAARRLDFRSRYGYAPEMVEGVERAFLVLDPCEVMDQMHAALFRAPWVSRLNMRHAGPRPAEVLADMGVLTGLIEAAAQGKLTEASFAQVWRKRRQHSPYLRHLIAITDASGHLTRSEAICRNVLGRQKAPRIRRRLQEIEAQKSSNAPPPDDPASQAGDQD
ncbi:MAG: hypothetical protein QM656_05070 [Paracoccaceae bacterium]